MQKDVKLEAMAEKRARMVIPIGHDTTSHAYRMAIGPRKPGQGGNPKNRFRMEPVMLHVQSNGSLGVVAEGDLSELEPREVYRFELEEDQRTIMSGTVRVEEKMIK